MMCKLLLSSVCKPFDLLADRFSASDQYAFRFTRDQELFTLYEHTHYSSLHLIAQNLATSSVVLEYPTLEQFEAEVDLGYEVIAISFMPINTERLKEMCLLIRRKSPKTRILIGGYGAVCAPELRKDPLWATLFDDICAGEGISYMRQFMGDTGAPEIMCRLPKVGASFPWLNPRPVGTVGVILSGLGCTQRCPFCVTSAYTEGRYIEVMGAEQIYQSMRGYWSSSPFTNSTIIYDENFLQQKDKVTSLGKLMQNDEPYGLRKLNYFAFASLSALATYDPEELLLNGVDTLWIGVESKFSPLQKRQGMTPEQAFAMLHALGIKTVGSWMIGQDFQTPENIEEDKKAFIALDPTYQQLSILNVLPSVPLYQSLQLQGRLPTSSDFSQYQIYGDTFAYQHFTHRELLDQLDRMYRAIYQQKGSAMMKTLEVQLNGLEWCRRSKHPLLKEHKADFFCIRSKALYPLLKTARAHAPTPEVARRLEELQLRYHYLLGKIRPEEEKIADQVLRKADEEHQRRQMQAPVPREEPFRRYTYPAVGQRSPNRPYTVKYPT